MIFRTSILLTFLLAASCAVEEAKDAPSPFALPVPHANNAVAIAEGPDGPTLYSFNGITADKKYTDIGHMAFACPIKLRLCKTLDPLPVTNGRLASVAATLAGKVYIFGGYSVEADDSEKSEPEVFRFDPDTGAYQRMADMPVPVDDAVAVTYQGRYVYLVSGWHDDGNVNLVQVFDTQQNSWARATDYPGSPVFGHAGGIAGGSMIIADGVKVVKDDRRYAATGEVWRGDIDANDHTKIRWRQVGSHPGTPFYRMASGGESSRNQIIFAGGSDNPYNYNGIGYNGKASPASQQVFGYDVAKDAWVPYAPLPAPRMDHRGLLFSGGYAYIVGGMDGEQRVVADITEFQITPQQAETKE